MQPGDCEMVADTLDTDVQGGFHAGLLIQSESTGVEVTSLMPPSMISTVLEFPALLQSKDGNQQSMSVLKTQKGTARRTQPVDRTRTKFCMIVSALGTMCVRGSEPCCESPPSPSAADNHGLVSVSELQFSVLESENEHECPKGLQSQMALFACLF